MSQQPDDRDERLERLADAEYFDGHACLEGDCPHDKFKGCFTNAYREGWRARDEDVAVLVEALERIGQSDCYTCADYAREKLARFRGKPK